MVNLPNVMPYALFLGFICEACVAYFVSFVCIVHRSGLGASGRSVSDDAVGLQAMLRCDGVPPAARHHGEGGRHGVRSADGEAERGQYGV